MICNLEEMTHEAHYKDISFTLVQVRTWQKFAYLRNYILV